MRLKYSSVPSLYGGGALLRRLRSFSWSRSRESAAVIAITSSFSRGICFKRLQPWAALSGTSRHEPLEETKKGIQRILSWSIESGEIPGIVVSIDRPGWRWSAATGKASIRPGIKALPDMKFRAASISKTFTAAATLKLSEGWR